MEIVRKGENSRLMSEVNNWRGTAAVEPKLKRDDEEVANQVRAML
jgi:hypothetical protein